MIGWLHRCTHTTTPQWHLMMLRQQCTTAAATAAHYCRARSSGWRRAALQAGPFSHAITLSAELDGWSDCCKQSPAKDNNKPPLAAEHKAGEAEQRIDTMMAELEALQHQHSTLMQAQAKLLQRQARVRKCVVLLCMSLGLSGMACLLVDGGSHAFTPSAVLPRTRRTKLRRVCNASC